MAEDHQTGIAGLPVIYTGTLGGASAGVSAAKLMHRVLKTAGLAGQEGIKPGSIPAAFGRRLWQQHRDLAVVARALGTTSFDWAAREIGVAVDDLPDTAPDMFTLGVSGDGHAVRAVRGTADTNKRAQQGPLAGPPRVVRLGATAVSATGGAR